MNRILKNALRLFNVALLLDHSINVGGLFEGDCPESTRPTYGHITMMNIVSGPRGLHEYNPAFCGPSRRSRRSHVTARREDYLLYLQRTHHVMFYSPFHALQYSEGRNPRGAQADSTIRCPSNLGAAC